jgi:hypothetical protein
MIGPGFPFIIPFSMKIPITVIFPLPLKISLPIWFPIPLKIPISIVFPFPINPLTRWTTGSHLAIINF